MLEDLSPPGHIGFAPSFVLLLGVLGIGWGSVIVFVIARAIRFARVQRDEHDFIERRATWPLVPGPSRVVHGRVEVDAEPPIAIEIDIDQIVTNHTSKNSRWHDWKETARRVVARPFRVVRDDGQTVRVEPGSDALVVDSLETSYPKGRPNARVRSAVVRAGDDIIVYGDLSGGGGGDAYRGAASFMLASPRRGRMLVATDAIRDRYGARIRHSWRAGIGLAIAFIVFHSICTAPFLTAMLFGTREQAFVTSARTYTVSGKHGPVRHWALTARTDDGFTFSGEVGPTAYAHTPSGTTIPVLRVGHSRWASYLGNEPTTHITTFFFGAFIAMILTLLALGSYDRSLAWYDRKRVLEPGGPGHWTGPPSNPTRN